MVGVGVVICLELGADLHMAQLMPLPLTVSCFSKIQIGFAFLVPAHPGSLGKRAVKRVCVCVELQIAAVDDDASSSGDDHGRLGAGRRRVAVGDARSRCGGRVAGSAALRVLLSTLLRRRLLRVPQPRLQLQLRRMLLLRRRPQRRRRRRRRRRPEADTSRQTR